MNRIYILIFFLALSVNVFAQGNLTLHMPNVTASCNTQITIPVKVSGFNNLLSLQGTIGWDINKLSFRGMESYGPAQLGLSSANFGLNAATNSGRLPFLWNAASMVAQTLADTTTLFSINFLVTGANQTTTQVQFYESPAPIEAINADLQIVPLTLNPGLVSIECSTVVQSSDTLSLFVPSMNTGCNSEIIVPVYVSSFNNLLSAQGTLSWDYSKLSFQRIENYGPALLAMNNSNFGINSVSMGKLPFIWNAADGVGKTLNDSTVLFSIRFVVRNSSILSNTPIQFVENPTPLEAVNANLQVMNFKTGIGNININCTVTNNFTFIAPSINATCNGTIDVPVKVKNFNNILSMQGSFQWDPGKLQYQSIVSYGPSSLSMGAGNFGASSANAGLLSFSWNDADLSGETLADSTTLFSIRFNVTGTNASSSYLQFSSLPTTLEVVNTALNVLPVQTVNGICNINCLISTYRFTGNGNWNLSSNWQGSVIPPALLPSGSIIIVDPIVTGECILNVSQRISQGATFQVVTGKKLRILGSLNVQ